MTIDPLSYLEGVAPDELEREYGLPLFVYSRSLIEKRGTELLGAITYPKKKLLFAMKANSNLELIKIINNMGYGVDTVSTQEVELALMAGVKKHDIIFTGNNCTKEELVYCIENGILVNSGSLYELDLFGSLNPGGKVSIRINPDVGAGIHDHTITGGVKSKFGVYFDRVGEIKEVLKKHNLKLLGLHMHVGSGFLDPDPFMKGMEALLNVARQFEDLDFVDFGGGIGIPYKPAQNPMSLKEFGERVDTLLFEFSRGYGKELSYFMEPGRYLVGEAGTLLAQVTSMNQTPKFKFIGTNTGFNHLIRPMAYESYHEIVNYSNLNGEKEDVVVAGNLCESGDVFTFADGEIGSRAVQKAKPGDVLGILFAGAYGYSMASNYNSRLRPAEVLLDKGSHRLIRRRETLKDILATRV